MDPPTATDNGLTDLALTVTRGPLRVSHEKSEPFNNLIKKKPYGPVNEK